MGRKGEYFQSVCLRTKSGEGVAGVEGDGGGAVEIEEAQECVEVVLTLFDHVAPVDGGSPLLWSV